MPREYTPRELLDGVRGLLAIEFAVTSHLIIAVNGLLTVHIDKKAVPLKDRPRLEALVHGFTPKPWIHKVVWE